MAKLSTPSHPCELAYAPTPQGVVNRCGKRAFRKIGNHWFCRVHLTAARPTTSSLPDPLGALS